MATCQLSDIDVAHIKDALREIKLERRQTAFPSDDDTPNKSMDVRAKHGLSCLVSSFILTLTLAVSPHVISAVRLFRVVMTKSIKRSIILGITLLFLLLLGSGLVVYSTADPDTTLGFSVFRSIYATPIPKGWFLQRFSEGLRQNNGGYIGQPVDDFLCSRLEATDSDAERIAIAEFYISQAGGREGERIAEISDEAKQKVVFLILTKLDSYEPNRAEDALLIVDWLRRGNVVCKAHISNRNVPGNEWQKWWLESGVFEAKSKYRAWWNTNLEWREKKQINPFAESDMVIRGGCG